MARLSSGMMLVSETIYSCPDDATAGRVMKSKYHKAFKSGIA